MTTLLTLLLAACGKDQGPLLPPAVLEVDENPFASRVAWTTEDPLATELTFNCGGEVVTGVESSAATDHAAVVIGLRAGVACEVVVSATSGGQTWQTDPKTFTPAGTDLLPVLAPTGAPVEPGWTLLTLAREGSESPGSVVLIDEEGAYRWVTTRWGYGSPAAGYDARVIPLDDDLAEGLLSDQPPTGVLVGGFSDLFPPGIVTWDGRLVWDSGLDMHHEITPTGSGLLMYLGYDTCDGLTTNSLVEIDRRTGDERWSWRSCTGLPAPEPPSQDWDHLNAFTIDGDPATGDLIVSARNLNQIFRIERASGEVVWSVGEGGSAPLAGGESLYAPHGVSLTDDGTLLFVDNGDPEARPTTRVVEVALAPDSSSAEIVWQWDPGAFHPILGDADRQPGGTTLVVLGTVSTDDSHVYELEADGTIAWDVVIPGEWAPNRAIRVTPPERVIFVDPAL